MNNHQIAQVFSDIAGLLQVKGESVFKIRAYERAAEVIENLDFELAAVAAHEARLREIPGFGEAITSKVQELLRTGKLEFYEKLKSEFPAGVLEIMNVHGIGPKTALRVVQELGIADLNQLEAALESGAFAKLPRVGERNAATILRHLKHRLAQGTRMSIGQALPLAEQLIDLIGRHSSGIRNLAFAGSLRRGRETVGNIDLVCTADRPAEVVQALAGLPMVTSVLEEGPDRGSVMVQGRIRVDLRAGRDESFGSLLAFYTGSSGHQQRLKSLAGEKGLVLNEFGLVMQETGSLEKFATEEKILARLGLQYIPPEIREDTGEIEAALAGELPSLIFEKDIRGDLHTHTDWTDGRATMEEMAREARRRGLEYVAVTDHSPSQTVARGLSPARLEEHNAAVRALDGKIEGLRLLTGTEMDILPDGSLDYPEASLAGLDVVLGSIHSAMDQDRENMTGRVIKAMRNPHVDIVAHLTTRLTGRRAPVEMDFEAICRAAVETGTILEINASKERLDLRDEHVRRARDLGVIFSLSTDSHVPSDFQDLRYGVLQARRGWCEKWRVVNSLPFDEFRAFISAPKSERYARISR